MENYENETTVVNFIVVLVKQNSVNREKNKILSYPKACNDQKIIGLKILQKNSSKKIHQKYSQKKIVKNIRIE